MNATQQTASNGRATAPALALGKAGREPEKNVGDLSVAVGALMAEVGKVIVGKKAVLEKLVVNSLSEGAHILFEDVPGLAKSVMAGSFSKAAGCTFHRIQF